ncbi:MAG: N-acetyltransferase family protein [Patescibacteria group bacterium]|nr:GNAT family N-acetyltransferase [Patescibacteria group bacterium]
MQQFVQVEEKHLSQTQQIYNYYVDNSIATYACEHADLEAVKSMVYFENSRFSAYVVAVGDEVCGFFILGPFNKKEGYAKTGEITIYLKNGFTGKGVGEKIVEFIENVAEERGFHTLLAHVTVTNEQSVNLFRGCGYEECGILKEVGHKFGEVLSDYYFQKIL